MSARSKRQTSPKLEPLLKIRNHHAASGGEPPDFDAMLSRCYLGYFENRYGEQWIFLMDQETGKSSLYGGNLGWDKEIEVINGRVRDIHLGQPEQLWLRGCWAAARQQFTRT